jgi:hypothetical protein
LAAALLLFLAFRGTISVEIESEHFGAREVVMGWTWRVLFLLAVVVFAFTFAVVACDDDDDDDNNDDNDDLTTFEGWLATRLEESTESPGSLYRIEENSVEALDPPAGRVLWIGNAADATVIWAADYDDVYQQNGATWQPVGPRHPCGDGAPNSGVVKPMVFGESSAVALCTQTHTFFSFDGTAWREEADDVGEFTCAAADRCLFATSYDVRLWEGQNEIGLAPLPGYPQRLAFTAEGRPMTLFNIDDAGDYHLELWAWREGAWEPGASFEAGTRFWSPALFAPVDDTSVALCARASDGDGCWLLSPDGPAVRTNWPFFQRLTFAASGSGNGLGVAAEGDHWVLYQIIDEEATAIFELPTDETPTSFLVAADAE